MSRRASPRCSLCFEPVATHGADMMPLEIVEPRCAVTLRWHMSCAHTDPLFAQLGEAIEQPASCDADPFRDTYIAILDRTIARDVALLPCIADVRRDIGEIRVTSAGRHRVTMRGPGEHWGRPVMIAVRSPK